MSQMLTRISQPGTLVKIAVSIIILTLLVACSNDEAKIDTEATVQAAVEATQAAEPTDTPIPPTDTPIPPTNTPEPPTNTPTPVPPTETPTSLPPTPEPIELPSSYSYYVDPDGHFELELPDGWDVDPDEASVTVISPDDRALISVMSMAGDGVLDDAALERQGEDFLEEFVGQDGEIRILGSQLEADGSISFDFEAETDKRTAIGILYVEQRGLDIFHFILSANSDVWDDYAEVFDQAIGTYYVTPENVETFLSPPLVLASQVEESERFFVDFPADWEINRQPGSIGAVAADGDSKIIAVTLAVEFDLEEEGVENYADLLMAEIYENASYTIDAVEPQADGSYGISYTVDEDDKILAGYMYIEQHNQQLYHLIFQTELSDWFGMASTYGAVVESYVVNPPAGPAISSTATPVPVPPTPVPQANPFAPQSGRSRLYVFSEIGEEISFNINDIEYKILPNNLETPVAIDLDPGRYTYSINVPDRSANGEVTMGADESWAIGVRGDYALYDPFLVYPDQ